MKALNQFSLLFLSAGMVFPSVTLAGAKGKPGAEVTKVVDGLAVMVQMGQAAFAQDERVGLTVTVKNTGRHVARLNATQFLGSTTFGRHEFALSDAVGAKWAVVRDLRAILSRALVRLIPVTLQPNKSFTARSYLPLHGMFFQKAGAAGVRVLPIGKYKLAVSMKLGGKAFAIPAVTFEIRKQPKLTELPGALPKAKIITAARVFFKARLGQFQAANRGKAFWDELAANQFAPRITEAGRHWSVRFDREIESKVGKQVMGMIILLDVKGKVVNPNPAFGFYPDKNAERPRMQINLPVRARRSKPLVPRR